MTSITETDAAGRIAQLRASLEILKANPGMSITHVMATGPDGETISVHDAGAQCFCFLGRVARDHAPAAVYDDDAVYDWLDNSFLQPLGGEHAANVTGRLMSLNDHAETKADRFEDIEHYINLLEARFVHGAAVEVF